jgi:hypothetical protein
MNVSDVEGLVTLVSPLLSDPHVLADIRMLPDLLYEWVQARTIARRNLAPGLDSALSKTTMCLIKGSALPVDELVIGDSGDFFHNHTLLDLTLAKLT